MSKKVNAEQVSIWYLSELLLWDDHHLLPAKPDQDIENYCQFLGAYEVLTWFKGVVPVIHGPVGCIASFNATRGLRHKNSLSGLPYFSTHMNEEDVVFGGEKKLLAAVKKAVELGKPQLIVVLTNCCAEIIGEKTEVIVKKIKGEVPCPILTLNTGGCMGDGFRQGADKAFKLLIDFVAKQCPSQSKQKNLLNLFNRRLTNCPAADKELKEITRLLQKIGLSINSYIGYNSSFADLINLSKASVNASVCFSFADAVMDYLHEKFNQPFCSRNFPLGLKATVDWLQEIAFLCDLNLNLAADLEIKHYAKKIAALRKKVAGRYAFIWLPSEKGLAVARFAQEIGLKPILFSLSYYLIKQLKTTLLLYAEEGFDFPVCLKGKQVLMRQWDSKPFAEKPLLFMARKFWTGDLPTVTLNFSQDSLLGLKGIDTLISLVEQALEEKEKDYALFNRYVETQFPAHDWVANEPPMPSINPEAEEWA
jgi:nitrogenase molybdenum-cofactor synthesis protein NifE